jgi:hypothetical protein
MSHERSGRNFHTRFGWWFMTHPRGGAALLGSVAVVALTAEAAYIAHQWHRLDSSFHRAIAVGLVAIVLLCLIDTRLGIAEPLGSDRSLARHRARTFRKIYAPVPFVVIAAGFTFGTYVEIGLLLGVLPFMFGMFAITAVREIAHPHVLDPRARR